MILRPLGAMERALLISDRYAPFNVVAVLQLESPPAPARVEAALSQLQERQPLLRARILDLGGRPHFAAAESTALPFMVMPRSGEDAWLALAQAELCQRFDSAVGPLFRCHYLFQPPRAELVLTLQHTIVDAASVSILLHSLLELCTGQTASADAPSDPAPAVEAGFPSSFRGLPLGLHALGYASRQVADELRYRWEARGLPRSPVHLGALPRLLTFETDPALTASLVRRSRKERLTLNSVLNAALVQALHRRHYAGRPRRMRTITFPDLRPFAASPLPPESMAAYFSMLRYTVPVTDDQPFWEMARGLHEQIYRSLKRGDKYVAAVMSEGLMKMLTRLRSVRMATTALSYTGVPWLRQDYAGTTVRAVHGFISNIDLGPDFTAQVSLFAERLIWDIVYLDPGMDRSQALTIVREVQDILRAAVSTP